MKYRTSDLNIYKSAQALVALSIRVIPDMNRAYRDSVGRSIRNDSKRILIEIGIDFVGQVIKPHRRETRRKTVRTAIARCGTVADEDLLPTANSYLGQLRQTKSHGDRARVCRVLMKRGRSIEMNLTKTYRKGEKTK